MAYNYKDNKNEKIKIELHDQLPVSQHSDIEVEIIEISGASHDENTGILK